MMTILLFLGEIHAYTVDVVLVTLGCHVPCENEKRISDFLLENRV